MLRTIHRMTTTTITKIMIKIIKAPVHIGAEISNPMLKRYQWQSWLQTPREKLKMQLMKTRAASLVLIALRVLGGFSPNTVAALFQVVQKVPECSSLRIFFSTPLFCQIGDGNYANANRVQSCEDI